MSAGEFLVVEVEEGGADIWRAKPDELSRLKPQLICDDGIDKIHDWARTALPGDVFEDLSVWGCGVIVCLKQGLEMHPQITPGFRDNIEAAKTLAGMHYQGAAELFSALSLAYAIDADADRARGRLKLADALSETAKRAGMLAQELGHGVWPICAPHMKGKRDV